MSTLPPNWGVTFWLFHCKLGFKWREGVTAPPRSYKWLVWRSGNGIGHIIEVTLRRARLVLGLVTDNL